MASRKEFFLKGSAVVAGVGLGIRLAPKAKELLRPEVNNYYTFNISLPPGGKAAEAATPTPIPIISVTATPTETATPTPTPTATATLTATVLPTVEPVATRDTRPNLCAVSSFIVPDHWWTGRSRTGESQLQAEDVVRFLNAPPEAPAKDALLKYLKENGLGQFMPINLIPETVRAEDIPPQGTADVMADLDLKGFMEGLGLILGMDEKAYSDAVQGQLKFENAYLVGLEQMLYRKRITENGQARVAVFANRQTIEVTREMMSACYERWDNSPIALIEGQDQDGSRLVMAFDGYCGNLFLAIKFPPLPTPTPTATATPKEENGNGDRETPTPTEVPPQEPVDTPTSGDNQ